MMAARDDVQGVVWKAENPDSTSAIVFREPVEVTLGVKVLVLGKWACPDLGVVLEVFLDLCVSSELKDGMLARVLLHEDHGYDGALARLRSASQLMVSTAG
jgi:hypothetical protein